MALRRDALHSYPNCNYAVTICLLLAPFAIWLRFVLHSAYFGGGKNEKLHFLSTNFLTVVDEINAFNFLPACPSSLFLYLLTRNKHARVF